MTGEPAAQPAPASHATEPVLVSSGLAATYVCGTNVSCNGANDGSINLTVTGGADCVAYTFNWSNGTTTEDVSQRTTAGNYSVTHRRHRHHRSQKLSTPRPAVTGVASTSPEPALRELQRCQ